MGWLSTMDISVSQKHSNYTPEEEPEVGLWATI